MLGQLTNVKRSGVILKELSDGRSSESVGENDMELEIGLVEGLAR